MKGKKMRDKRGSSKIFYRKTLLVSYMLWEPIGYLSYKKGMGYREVVPTKFLLH